MASRLSSSTGLLLSLLALCSTHQLGQPLQAAAAQTIVIRGSSTVLPFSQAAIKAHGRRGDLLLQAEATGTTAGLREFCNGKSGITAASRPISQVELKACAAKGVRFLELPVAFDAITVVVPASNGWAKEISTEQLRLLWNRQAQGRINRWKQLNSRWPDEPIKLCGPGRDSGTYDTFNKVINGSESNSRQDYTASEDDNVLVRCVANQPLALGYFGFDYYQAHRQSLKALAVIGSRGAVVPSVASVQASRYLPLSRPLFFYVNELNLRQSPGLRQFINNTLQNGGRIARDAGVIPLNDSTYRLVVSKLYRQVLGSAYAGTLPVGLTVGQTLERSFDALKKPEFR